MRRAARGPSSTSTRSTTTTWRRGEAPLHRPARRPQAARARRDVLQLGDRRGCSGRTYVHNDLIFVRAAISTEYIPVRPADLPQLLPAPDGLRATFAEIFARLRLEPAVRRPRRATSSFVVARARAPGRTREWPRLEPNYQVQVLGSAFYRNKAAYVRREDRQRQRRAAVRRPGPPRRRRPARARRDRCSTRERSTSSSRSRARTSWSTWTCRRATSSSCGR